ncbi:MAG: hypothetical protein JSS69_16660 [Acidobacteria bacterium]|nr:hypothetical protein [Acidobacteriota bacterium]MBS1867547.1 hypothetical protein [Acidobacteriota bacterium]
MTPHAIQLHKEIRLVFWPWLLLLLVALYCLLPFHEGLWNFLDERNVLLPVGCFLGIPFLASLPFGSEFQYKTITHLLAQPKERRIIWAQKLLISLCASLSAAALYLLANRTELYVMPDFWRLCIWMAATAAGAITCTLIAKSSIGGLALSSGSFWIVFVVWSRLSDVARKDGILPASFLWASAAAFFVYCAGLILAGRRLFLHLESADGALTTDIASRSLFLHPGWLRARPRGAILNLIRREFHLLRLVWLFGFISLFVWTALLLFGYVRRNGTDFQIIPVVLALLFGLLTALLAGALSLGEERTQGTHEAQLTLPMPASIQWSVKLFVALSSSVVCAVCFPMSVFLVRGWFAADLFSYVDHGSLWIWVAEAISVTLLAFWCASIVKGTVRAILLFLPMLAALLLASSTGIQSAYSFSQRFRFQFQSATANLDPFSFAPYSLAFIDRHAEFLVIFIVVAPTLAVGLIQSRRMFSRQLEESKIRVVRRALPMPTALLVSSFLVSIGLFFVWNLRMEQQTILREAHRAIESFEANSREASSLQVTRLTFSELSKNSAVSSQTNRWLTGSTIVVRRDPVQPGEPFPSIQWPYEMAYPISTNSDEKLTPYSATIRTANGHTCNLRFRAASQTAGGILSHSCQ